MFEPLNLECQDCGWVIVRDLDAAQQLAVARNPENFILLCRECEKYYHEEP